MCVCVCVDGGRMQLNEESIDKLRVRETEKRQQLAQRQVRTYCTYRTSWQTPYSRSRRPLTAVHSTVADPKDRAIIIIFLIPQVV